MTHEEYLFEIIQIRHQIPKHLQSKFERNFFDSTKDPSKIESLSWFPFLQLGYDRIANGQIMLGILKLITLGGVGIWVYVDMFFLEDAVMKKNISIATNLRETMNVDGDLLIQETPTSLPQSSKLSNPAQIQKLFELLNSGAITQEEYNKEKAKLLL